MGRTSLVILLSSLIVSGRSYPSLLARCTQCPATGEEREVCGSDWRTYRSECEVEWTACKRNWNITVLSEGRCESQCPSVELGRTGGRVSCHLLYR